jgi:predicted nucleic acid-binding protein
MKEPSFKCIVDSCVILDFEHGSIIRVLFRLPYELLTTPMLLREIKTFDTSQLFSWGLIRCELSPEDTQAMFSLRQQHPGLSVPDCSALVLALNTSGILLTGENPLRKVALQMGVERHGTLWILDQAISRHLLSAYTAGQALINMMRRGSRFPKKECRKRLVRWLPGQDLTGVFNGYNEL